MNRIEERLKDAYVGATQTVRPDRIRGLDEQAATITGRHRKSPSRVLYWAAPLAAATAVAAIGIGLGLGTGAPVPSPPRHHQPTHHTTVAPTGSPAERFLGALSTSGKKIDIINATSGVTVAAITSSDPLAMFGTPATGDGVRYVVASWEPGHCGSTRLAQFTLNSSGQPGPLTELTGLRRLVAHLWMSQLAISANDSTLAFFANTCVSRFVAVNPHIGVIKLASRRVANWTLAQPTQLADKQRRLHLVVRGTKNPRTVTERVPRTLRDRARSQWRPDCQASRRLNSTNPPMIAAAA